MMVVGLTGGIGSGKTTVIRMFQNMGISVYVADDEAKKLMQSSDKIKNKLIESFGELSYKEGKLNTSYLAEIVFSDKQKLKIINNIVHPEVKLHFEQYKKTQKIPYFIFENAILFENGFDDLCDYIITVTAPLEDRILRVQQRDGLSRTQILNRINNQWTDEKKVLNSDFVIENTNLEETKKKVLEINDYLLKITELNNK